MRPRPGTRDASRPCPWRRCGCPPGPCPRRDPRAGQRDGAVRLDVLVHAEEVVRVVGGLDRGQPLVVAAVGGLHPLLALVHHEVHVAAARRVRVLGLPVVDAPVPQGRQRRRVGVDAGDDGRVGGVPVGERRLVRARRPARRRRPSTGASSTSRSAAARRSRRAPRPPRRGSRGRSRRASTTGRPARRGRRRRRSTSGRASRRRRRSAGRAPGPRPGAGRRRRDSPAQHHATPQTFFRCSSSGNGSAGGTDMVAKNAPSRAAAWAGTRGTTTGSPPSARSGTASDRRRRCRPGAAGS